MSRITQRLSSRASTRILLADAVIIDDVDLDTGVLTVRASKFGKSRLVPVHRTTLGTLRIHAGRRDLLCPATACPAFFLDSRSRRLDARNTSHTFADLLPDAGIDTPPGTRRPRLHDLATAVAEPSTSWSSASTGPTARGPP